MALRPQIVNPAANLGAISFDAGPSVDIGQAVRTSGMIEREGERRAVNQVLLDDGENIINGDLQAFNKLAVLPGGLEAAKNILALAQVRDEQLLNNTISTLKSNKLFNTTALKENNEGLLRKKIQVQAQKRLGQGDADGAEELMRISQLPTIDEIQNELSDDLAIADAGLNALQSVGFGKSTQFQKTGSFLVKDPKSGKVSIATGVFDPATGKLTTELGELEGEVVSRLGETATEETQREIEKAGKTTEIVEKTKLDVKASSPEGQAKLRELRQKETANIDEARDNMRLVDILSGSDLDLIYGRGESLVPEVLRSQEGQNLIAQRDRLVAQLELGAAGKLKGSGSVSEGERAILANSATVLKRPDISAELATQELARIRPIFEKIVAAAEGDQTPTDEIEIDISEEEFRNLPRAQQQEILRKARRGEL